MNHHYWAYGLTFRSDLEFPELLEFAGPHCEAAIRLLPDALATDAGAPESLFHFHEVGAARLSFQVRGVAGYLVEDGRTISVSIDPRCSSMREVRLYLLATAMAGLLLQRGTVPFHAAALTGNEGLTLISGASGAGKSTLSAGLMRKGHTLFSDDVIALAPDGTASASYPMIKLWGETMARFPEQRFNDRSFPVKPGIDKFGIFYHDRFDTRSYPSARLLLLYKSDDPELSCTELTGSDALVEAFGHIYRPGATLPAVLARVSFPALTALVRRCRVYRICRPAQGDPEQLISLVEKMMR